MNLIQAIILGIVEGLTEFLPVSSTGHQTIVAGLMGLQIDDPSITSFIAVIQVGAIAALVIYLRKDIGRLFMAWIRGLFDPGKRRDPSYREAWMVIIGSLPIAMVGIAGPRPDQGTAALPLGGRGGVDPLGFRDAASRRRSPSRTGTRRTSI